MPHEIIVAVTGASGSLYARRLLELLSEAGVGVHLVVSEHGAEVAAAELGVRLDPSAPSPEELLGRPAPSVRGWGVRDMSAPIASGSCTATAMAIVPCSMRTLGCIAGGCGVNLVHRAADVMLKERRRLILVPRETPLSTIHLQNMLELSRAGACILPATPAFYHHPHTVDELVDGIAARVLDQLGIEHGLAVRWQPGEYTGK